MALPKLITHGSLIVPGVALAGTQIPERRLQQQTTKFWGLNGESRIAGGRGGRQIVVPGLIYDDDTTPRPFDTPEKLWTYIDVDLNTTQVQIVQDLTIHREENNVVLAACAFEGFRQDGQGVIKDVAGTIGGDYIVRGVFLFYQLSGS